MDKYYVYRPMLDLIGFTEGTDRGDGYNETLAYGAYTGGDVNLVGMTLDEIDALQTKMLRHPKNKWKSSACGRYQIVRTTLRNIKDALNLPGDALFDETMQDRMACYLLGVRGIDKYLAGRLSEDTLINNLAREWASLPNTEDRGHYSGQHAAVTTGRVRKALAEVRRRHLDGQPLKEVIPETVETEVKRKTTLWQWITGILGSGGAGAAGLLGANWQTIAAIGAVMIVMLLIVILLRGQIVKAVRDIRTEMEA